jgi:hypothetical protein
MNKVRKVLMLSALFGVAALGGVASAEPDAKWKVIFDHWAEVDGELVLRIAPVGGTPIDVSTKVPKGMTENNAAELVAGSLKAQLGGGYKVSIDDSEKVVIKKTGKTPKFEVSLVSSTATGLNVKIKH